MEGRPATAQSAASPPFITRLNWTSPPTTVGADPVAVGEGYSVAAADAGRRRDVQRDAPGDGAEVAPDQPRPLRDAHVREANVEGPHREVGHDPVTRAGRVQPGKLQKVEQAVGGLVHDLGVVAGEHALASGEPDPAARGGDW